MVSEMESVLKQVSGVECSSIASGIKNNGELDLSLILLCEGSVTAAVFTQNVFCAAPVLVAKNVRGDFANINGFVNINSDNNIGM